MAFKVCVCGGAGGIGQPLSMQMAMDERVSELSVFDLTVAMVPSAGVAADLEHIETPCVVKGYSMDPNCEKPVDVLGECLAGCHLVLVPAGVPRKPGMSRDDLFATNANIAAGIVEACAKFCPNAVVALIVNPVNSVVPAMCEMYKKCGLDHRKIVGVTSLDVVRANKFVSAITKVPPSAINVPVVGGHAGATIVPLFSQDPVAASIHEAAIPDLDKRVQDAGTEVVNAKAGKGSATLSMAYAGARLGKAVLSGLSGNPTTECAYVASNVSSLPYFASKVTFGQTGVEHVHPLGSLNAHEEARVAAATEQLRGEIQSGLDYAEKTPKWEGIVPPPPQSVPSPDAKREAILQQFRVADMANQGMISREELTRIMGAIGSPDITNLLNALDPVGEGLIRYEDFLDMVFNRTYAPVNAHFAHLEEAPPDPILGTTLKFNADTDPRKVNLGVGAYRTEDGKPYVLPVIKKAEEQVLAELGTITNKEYSTIDGPALLKDVTQKLLFGDSACVKESRIASAQTLSGTGSLRLVGEFIRTRLPPAAHKIYMSDPTWGNHAAIFKAAGMQVKTYPYYDEATRGMNFSAMIGAFRAMPVGSTVLVHACAHNPTGVDPTPEQWQAIAEVIRLNKLVPVVDSAYQGYASGDLDKDAYSLRLFDSLGIEMFVCQSFAKNLGLYGERIGMVHIVCDSQDVAKRALSQMKLVIRAMYSSPPIHGAQLVMKVLGSPEMFDQWKGELKAMADRILTVRSDLRRGLEQKGTPGTWNHITDQIGMFSYTGLTPAQVDHLIQEHIYLLKSGRISLAGLNSNNVQYMVDTVDAAVREGTVFGG